MIGAPEMDRSSDIGHIGLGLLLTGARVGWAASRAALAPVRVAVHAPLVGEPLRRAGANLAADGEQTIMRARAQLMTLTEDVLGAPDVADAADRVLAGPLTEAIACAVGEHRVVERVAAQVLGEAHLDRLVDAVLEDPRTEHVIKRVLESRLLDGLTDQVLDSREMQRIVEHIASSPEVLAAVTHHTESLAGDVVADVRTRSERADDVVERRVRRVLRRPRPG